MVILEHQRIPKVLISYDQNEVAVHAQLALAAAEPLLGLGGAVLPETTVKHKNTIYVRAHSIRSPKY